MTEKCPRGLASVRPTHWCAQWGCTRLYSIDAGLAAEGGTPAKLGCGGELERLEKLIAKFDAKQVSPPLPHVVTLFSCSRFYNRDSPKERMTLMTLRLLAVKSTASCFDLRFAYDSASRAKRSLVRIRL